MKQSHLPERSPVRRCCVLLALLALCGACQPQPAQQARVKRPRPTPRPHFGGLVEAANRDTLLTYARSLTYDSTPPAADAQVMLVKVPGGGFRPGPWAVLEPEIGSAAVRDYVNGGRVVAKLTLDDRHPDAGLAKGVSYVWVDSAQGGFRAVIVPESPTDSVVHVHLRYHPGYGSPGDTLLFAIARLTPPPHAAMSPAAARPGAKGGKDGICIPCDYGWCCSSDNW